MELSIALAIFVATYLLNATYITVFYHRALAHQAVELTKFGEWLVKNTGNWITGIDPAGWVCMHRLHHQYSDTIDDPHSPVYHGIFPLLLTQLHSFKRALRGIIVGEKKYRRVISDLDLRVHWLNTKRLWLVPYMLHFFIAVVLGVLTQSVLIGTAYWVGMMSHPVQGWLVNAFGHHSGYRNFNLDDNSRNNTLVAWFVMGEGYQNNHHKYPTAAKFSIRWFEVDVGYFFCILCQLMGLVRIPKQAEKPALVSEPQPH